MFSRMKEPIVANTQTTRQRPGRRSSARLALERERVHVRKHFLFNGTRVYDTALPPDVRRWLCPAG